MDQLRNNHYVPIWYQEGFLTKASKGLIYLDLHPPLIPLPNGRSYRPKSRMPNAAPARCFVERDLYTTTFGSIVNVEIERMLFGRIDTAGSKAVRAIIGSDVAEWTRNFEAFFVYLDAQKLRTPKGLAWLRSRYPALTQHELMYEMQAVRLLHCSTWAHCVREIVSAKDAETKFIISDHPVTVFNHAVSPDTDPSIALNATHTLFALDQDHCLILTHLDYATSPQTTDPTAKSPSARNFRQALARTDTFIRSRSLTSREVATINGILKSRAERFVAAGQEDWLHPPEMEWAERRHVLLPDQDELSGFGGETYASFKDGSVHYQDAYGRTEPPHEALFKVPPTELSRNDDCPCGSGQRYRKCCKDVPAHLRPSWTQLSIRERNLILINGIHRILGITPSKSWTTVREELTDEKIKKVYELFGSLWPRDTDLLDLLPKPDGRPRAVFTGAIDPPAILEFIPAASLYFGHLLIQSPFLHPRHTNPEFSPVHNPQAFRLEILKSVSLMLDLAPAIDMGLITLFPDPLYFDSHVMRQMLDLCEQRIKSKGPLPRDRRSDWIRRGEVKRHKIYFPQTALERDFANTGKSLNEREKTFLPQILHQMRQADPLASLQDFVHVPGQKSGLMMLSKLLPNFEITVYLAQATGSFIVTETEWRWNELKNIAAQQLQLVGSRLDALRSAIQHKPLALPVGSPAVQSLCRTAPFLSAQAVIADIFNHLNTTTLSNDRTVIAKDLAAKFARAREATQRAVRNAGTPTIQAVVEPLIPKGGIGHPTINRLLVTSGVEHYLHRVPMAFCIRRQDQNFYDYRSEQDQARPKDA